MGEWGEVAVFFGGASGRMSECPPLFYYYFFGGGWVGTESAKDDCYCTLRLSVLFFSLGKVLNLHWCPMHQRQDRSLNYTRVSFGGRFGSPERTKGQSQVHLNDIHSPGLWQATVWIEACTAAELRP